MPHDIPVLISGAGPAGLAAALELARRDVPLLLVERRPELSSHPRATVLSLRSMELVRSWGLEDAVRERAVDVAWTRPARRSRSATRAPSRAACSARPRRPASPRTRSSRCCSSTSARCRTCTSHSAPS
jgi:2-polyprenyl-6-methoxyphenol hydroxylase-like FAD-dependent oxidoreductase